MNGMREYDVRQYCSGHSALGTHRLTAGDLLPSADSSLSKLSTNRHETQINQKRQREGSAPFRLPTLTRRIGVQHEARRFATESSTTTLTCGAIAISGADSQAERLNILC